MNYHVFVVDKTTFRYHLEYMFAGTGAKNQKSPFLLDPSSTSIHSSVERNLVGMIADISRIRTGDKILFYLQSADGRPGQFFGVFKAASTAFFDECNEENYLRKELGKALTFRIRIEPDTVYRLGVSEHLYLDSLTNIQHPYEMCWSMIYRKLKGNRGCTMLTDYEYNSLVKLLKQVNNCVSYSPDDKNFSYNINEGIVAMDAQYGYQGKTDSLDIQNRLLYKAGRRNAFEVHLQAYLLQNYHRYPLQKILLPLPDADCWIGNEVSCGVGMQRIDLLIKQETNNAIYIKLIELKCVVPENYILEQQLPWYIRWLSEYMIPNYTAQGKTVHLIPCVIAFKEPAAFIEKCKEFQKIAGDYKDFVLEPLEYISFTCGMEDIEFEKKK